MNADPLSGARQLLALGVPVGVAPPCPSCAGRGCRDCAAGYRMPYGWQNTPADPGLLDAWTPGSAVFAVMGHGLDCVDLDIPKMFGPLDLAEFPAPVAVAATKSGGLHLFVRSLGVRSRDGFAPGIDLKAGDPDGQGRGFVFLAPTVGVSKVTGLPAAYAWQTPPPPAIGPDPHPDASERLRARIAALRAGSGLAVPAAEGPAFAELPPHQQEGLSDYVRATVEALAADLAAAVPWPEGHTDAQGRGWEKMTADAAHKLACLAASGWAPLTAQQAWETFERIVPNAIAAAVPGKWEAQARRAQPLPMPAQRGLSAAGIAAMGLTPPHPDDAPAPNGAAAGAQAIRTGDEHVARAVLDELRPRLVHVKGLGWHKYHRTGLWRSADKAEAAGLIHEAMIRWALTAMPHAEDKATVRALGTIWDAPKRNKVMEVLEPLLKIDAGQLDNHPDLLAVGNGVVDLRTGQLGPHDPALFLTRGTATPYVPGAQHPDWAEALTVLPPDAADWFRVRVGQAITGHTPDDARIVFMQADGENGKTSLIDALANALGDHMTTVPREVLLTDNGDRHPAELMTLRGARLAYVEEMPQSRNLDVRKLKALTGTNVMRGRLMRQDWVEWRASHSLFVTTNYTPGVVETDHGTWRRLCMLPFPYTFVDDPRHPGERRKDPALGAC